MEQQKIQNDVYKFVIEIRQLANKEKRYTVKVRGDTKEEVEFNLNEAILIAGGKV